MGDVEVVGVLLESRLETEVPNVELGRELDSVMVLLALAVAVGLLVTPNVLLVADCEAVIDETLLDRTRAVVMLVLPLG